jgi:hypothetical protein
MPSLKKIAVLCTELVSELDSLSEALQLVCHEHPEHAHIRRSLLQDLLALVTATEHLWVKNLRLSTAVLATVHAFVARLPDDEQEILLQLFDPSTNMIGPLAKLVQASTKQCRLGKRGKYCETSEFYIHKVAKTDHACADFDMCALRAHGLCGVKERNGPPQENQTEYVYFKDRNDQCMHLHMQCYERHVMNAEYMRVLWTGKLLSFRTAELYHAIPIGERVQCCACRASTAIKLDPDELTPAPSIKYIQGPRAMLYYGSVSVNRHVLCVPCFTLLNHTPNVRQCIQCSSFANPSAVVTHIHGTDGNYEAEFTASSSA